MAVGTQRATISCAMVFQLMLKPGVTVTIELAITVFASNGANVRLQVSVGMGTWK